MFSFSSNKIRVIHLYYTLESCYNTKSDIVAARILAQLKQVKNLVKTPVCVIENL